MQTPARRYWPDPDTVDTGRLNDFRRLPLAALPTPLQPMDRLGAELSIRGLQIKRDDLTGLAGGGNKARKLEFLIADAVEKRSDHVITVGGWQSNHCRMTAAAAARSGMDCTLIVGDPDPGSRPGNLLLDEILGARLVFIGEATGLEMEAAMQREAEQLTERGRRPYTIPAGGSCPLGELGYVLAAREFARQAAGMEVDSVLVAVGSTGTAAGLVLGLKMFCPGVRLIGVSVSRSLQRLGSVIADMANDIADLLGISMRVTPDDYEMTDAFVGPRYGVASGAGLDAIRLVGRTEGILLDPVYTGKTMAGLIGLSREHRFAGSGGVVFWHTGGLPGLFAFERDFLRRRSSDG